jgi:uracil permease
MTYAILLMAIVTLIGVAEHVGEVRANGLILGNDHFKNPGVHRSLFGDAVAMLLVSLGMTQGVTTYGESNAVSSISGNKNTALIRGAGVIAVLLSLVGKFGAILETIPMPIIGGISLLLFSTLTTAGLNVIKETNENIMDFRNTLVIAIPIFITIASLLPENPLKIVVNSSLTLEGLSLATIVGIVLNLIIPKNRRNK